MTFDEFSLLINQAADVVRCRSERGNDAEPDLDVATWTFGDWWEEFPDVALPELLLASGAAPNIPRSATGRDRPLFARRRSDVHVTAGTAFPKVS